MIVPTDFWKKTTASLAGLGRMIRFFVLLLGGCWLTSGFAQGIAPPDAGTILRDIQRALPVPEPKLPPPPPMLQ